MKLRRPLNILLHMKIEAYGLAIESAKMQYAKYSVHGERYKISFNLTKLRRKLKIPQDYLQKGGWSMM